jgi:hypothetical protein
MKKLKIGKLYLDRTVGLSRSASGVVSFWCSGPIQIWNATTSGHDHTICVNADFLRELDDGAIEEVAREKDPFKRKRK